MPTVERSQEVNEIIGTPAPWLTRNGTWVLGAAVAALLLLAGFYRYPTTLAGELVLTTVDPPRQLPAKRDFDIMRVLVASGDSVQIGQTLLVGRQGGAKWEQVLSLEDLLFNQQDLGANALVDLEIPGTLVLGEIQNAVYDFRDAQELYRNLSARRLDAYTSRELEAMIARSEAEVRVLRGQQERLREAVVSTRTELGREEEMSSNGVTYTERLNTARERLDRSELDLQRNTGQLRATSFAIELMRNQIESYRSGKQGSTIQAGVELREAFDALQTAVARWKQNYTTVSPVAGQVVLGAEVREGNYIPEGEILATVLPRDAGGTVGRMDLDVRGSARVERGQRVVVEFPKWPALEYGTVSGRIASIAQVPVDGKLIIQVAFPAGLVTSTGKAITPDPFLRGEATLVLDQRRLLTRLFSGF